MTPTQDSIDYININKQSWDKRTGFHVTSEFYDVDGFVKGKTSLNDIELTLLGDVSNKTILHLQCHFGQDSLSLARLGAKVTGIDLSDQAIEAAIGLNEKLGLDAAFICCNIYDLPKYLNQQFDIVYTSYGTISWLPDLNKWGEIIAKFLNPNGKFVFVEFHPVVWMFDDNFEKVAYSYFNTGPIVETETGTYADKKADMQQKCIIWNHGIGEVVNGLINNGLEINDLKEYDYYTYDFLNHTEQIEEKKFRIKHLQNNIPLIFSIVATKKTII